MNKKSHHKTQFLLIVLLPMALYFSCNSPIKNKETEIANSTINEPPPINKPIDENSLVGFACFYQGRKSEPVVVVSEVWKSKNYVKLKLLLFSSKPAEKYLATLLCLKLKGEGNIKLSNEELNQIVKNKISNKVISFCDGCTQREEFTLSQLFNDKMELSIDVEKRFEEASQK